VQRVVEDNAISTGRSSVGIAIKKWCLLLRKEEQTWHWNLRCY